MSHITHFYHLAALDYIDASGPALVGTTGISVAMPPWTPQHQNGGGMVPPGYMVPVAGTNPPNAFNLVNTLVANYVTALSIRRKAHVLAAAIDGKHPLQNAQVPGGMTTKPSTVDWPQVVNLMNEIRVFIGNTYLPDLLTVALAFGGAAPVLGNPNVSQFAQGFGHGRALAYGAFPNPYNSDLKLFQDGAVTCGAYGAVPARVAVNPALITERVVSSYYNSPDNLHPSVGQTSPYQDLTNPSKYTWHKAPRYNGNAYEVGPIARMLATALAGTPTTVYDGDIPSLPGWTGGSNSIECKTNPGYADHLGAIPALGPLGAYTAVGLVTAIIGAGTSALFTAPWGLLGGNPGLVGGLGDLSYLFSTLGRHACRGLECKYIADAMGGGTTLANVATGVLGGISGSDPGLPMLSAVIQDPAAGSDVYTYQVMPKSLKMGAGLTEAPRGALGHWITSEFRKIVNYQAVVPSTWNACGTDGTQRGPIEQCLMGTNVGDPSVPGNADRIVNNLLKGIHPFDICVACSVHVTDSKGNNLIKFTMDPDGRVTKVETKEEA